MHVHVLRLPLHRLHRGGGALVIAHAQLQPQIAADEEERTKGPVVPETPGDASDDDAEGNERGEEPLPALPAPPQLKRHPAEHYGQQSRLDVKGNAGCDSEQQ